MNGTQYRNLLSERDRLWCRALVGVCDITTTQRVTERFNVLRREPPWHETDAIPPGGGLGAGDSPEGP